MGYAGYRGLGSYAALLQSFSHPGKVIFDRGLELVLCLTVVVGYGNIGPSRYKKGLDYLQQDYLGGLAPFSYRLNVFENMLGKL
jgi:hypothetical protein